MYLVTSSESHGLQYLLRCFTNRIFVSIVDSASLLFLRYSRNPSRHRGFVLWRRGKDSNPRGSKATGFRDQPNHRSGTAALQKYTYNTPKYPSPKSNSLNTKKTRVGVGFLSPCRWCIKQHGEPLCAGFKGCVYEGAPNYIQENTVD